MTKNNIYFNLYCLFIFTLPFNYKIFTVPVSSLIVVLLMLISIPKLMRPKAGAAFANIEVFALALLSIYTFVRIVNSVVYEEVSIRGVLVSLESFMIFVVSIIFLNNDKRVVKTMRVITISVLLVSLLTVLQSLGYWPYGVSMLRRKIGMLPSGLSRAVGVPLSLGEWGMMLSAALGVTVTDLVWALKNRFYTYKTLKYAFFLLLLLISVVIGQSRSTFVSTLIVIIVVLSLGYLIVDNNKISKYLYAVFFSSALICTSRFIQEVYELVVEIGPGAVRRRFDMYYKGINIFKENIIVGYGKHRVPDLVQIGGSSHVIHNKFIGSLASNGILGTVPFVLVLGVSIQRLYSKVKYPHIDPKFQKQTVMALAGIIGMTTELLFFRGSGVSILFVYMAIGIGRRPSTPRLATREDRYSRE